MRLQYFFAYYLLGFIENAPSFMATYQYMLDSIIGQLICTHLSGESTKTGRRDILSSDQNSISEYGLHEW